MDRFTTNEREVDKAIGLLDKWAHESREGQEVKVGDEDILVLIDAIQGLTSDVISFGSLYLKAKLGIFLVFLLMSSLTAVIVAYLIK